MFRHGFVLVSIATFVCAPALAQTTTRASVSSAGAQGNYSSDGVSISSGGRFVAFTSNATNLVPGDTNGVADVFVHDRLTGTTTRVSVSSSGAQGVGSSGGASISSDGRYVAFVSNAFNLAPGDTNGVADVFVRDRQNGTTIRVSVDSSGMQSGTFSGEPSISSDGRYVAFYSYAADLTPGDTNGVQDVFVHDIVNQTTTRASVDSNGVQGNLYSYSPSISADGRYVAFASYSTNLVPGDTNGFNADVFVHDMVSGATKRASVDSNGMQAIGESDAPSISADGRYVAFESDASTLVPGDTNGKNDIFVHDMLTGTTTRVSVDSSGAQANGHSEYGLSISAGGRFVAFVSSATNLVPGDTNGYGDVFVHDMLTGTTTRASVDSSAAQGNQVSLGVSISADGRSVAFASDATDLLSGDTNGVRDVFVRDGGDASAFTPLCFGDGTGGACPCGNTGTASQGCENSAATGGALLAAYGIASLSYDTVQFDSSGELSNALSIVLQGNSVIAPTAFGDGLRCAGGSLKRLYVKHAIGGAIIAPETSDPSISARSATLGDPIPLGTTRAYQVYYRDSNLVFCPGGFNVTNAIAIAWGS